MFFFFGEWYHTFKLFIGLTKQEIFNKIRNVLSDKRHYLCISKIG